MCGGGGGGGGRGNDLGKEGDGNTALARTTGTPDAVSVVLDGLGHVIVDDVGDVPNIRDERREGGGGGGGGTGTYEISKPRAATSVATRMSLAPDLRLEMASSLLVRDW